MSKIAFIYPGQGAQKAGMGADFYEHSQAAREIYDKASEQLGLDMKALCFEENDQLNLTEYTQAALVTTCLAMTRAVEAEVAHMKPTVTAGLSLGEYSAIAAAGGMKDIDAIGLVRKRGILMQNTVPAGDGAMCAIMGMTGDEIEAVLTDIDGASIANYNCPGQIVITGIKEAVESAAEQLKDAGAKRTIMLNVSGPFHSKMLEPAGEALAAELELVELCALDIPYITNVNAQMVSDIQETKTLLAQQVSMPVRWQQSMEQLIAEGVDTFIEIGPGKTLSGFMKKINREVTVLNIGTWEDIAKAADALAKEESC